MPRTKKRITMKAFNQLAQAIDAAEEYEWQKAQLLRRIDMALVAAFEAGRASERAAASAAQPKTNKAPRRAGRN